MVDGFLAGVVGGALQILGVLTFIYFVCTGHPVTALILGPFFFSAGAFLKYTSRQTVRVADRRRPW